MKPYTVLVLRSALGFDRIEDYSAHFRLPVIAFYEMTASFAGTGGANTGVEDAQEIASTLKAVARMFQGQLPPGTDTADPVQNAAAMKGWALEQLDKLKARIATAEQTLESADHDEVMNALLGLTESVDEIEAIAMAYDASIE